MDGPKPGPRGVNKSRPVGLGLKCRGLYERFLSLHLKSIHPKLWCFKTFIKCKINPNESSSFNPSSEETRLLYIINRFNLGLYSHVNINQLTMFTALKFGKLKHAPMSFILTCHPNMFDLLQEPMRFVLVCHARLSFCLHLLIKVYMWIKALMKRF